MPDYDFSQAEAAIIDSQHNTLRLLRDLLSRFNLKNVATFSSIKDATPLLTNATPDLLLVDIDGEEAEALRFVRTLRNEPGSPNPFACVILTTWQPTPVLLMRVANTGADDLLVKPVSPKQVQERVTMLVEARKKFVVTADYTGPDRRKSARDGTQVPLLDVPNTLRLKATNKWGTVVPRKLTLEAVSRVNEQKRLRASVQAAFLIEFAMPGLTRTPPERMAVEHLSRVPAMVDELLRRLPDMGDHSAIDTAARELKRLAEHLRAEADAGTVDAREVAHAQELSRALMQAVDRERPLESMVREVTAAVAGYRARLDQIAQAKADAKGATAAEAEPAKA
ncbi:MAG TPA: response regulator [Azospirillum sp.]